MPHEGESKGDTMLLELNVLEITRAGIWTVVLVSMPPLIIGLGVGLIVSIFQAVTSIQEQTLAFIPKILAVFAAIMFFGSHMITLLQNFFHRVMDLIPVITFL